MSAIRGIPSTVATNVGILVIGLFTGITTARALGPHDRGVLFGVQVWTASIAYFALLGVADSVVYFAEGDRSRARWIVAVLGGRLRAQAVISTAVAALPVWFLVRHGSTSQQLSALAVLAIVPLNVGIQSYLAVLRTAQRFGTWNLVRALPTCVYAAGVAMLLVFFRLTLATSLACLTVGVGTCYIVGRVVVDRDRRRTAWPDGDRREWARYGWRVTIADLPALANQRLDQLYLSLFVEPTRLGLYGVAVNVTGGLQALGVTLEQVLFPKLSASRRHDPVTTRRALVGGLAVGTVALVGVWLFAGELVTGVFGARYHASAPALRYLLPGGVFLVGSGVLQAAGKAANRMDVLIRAQLVGVVVTLVMLPPLVSAFGISGAAATSSVAYGAVFLVQLWGMRHAVRGDGVTAAARPLS